MGAFAILPIMTLAQIRTEVARYLGVVDITLDGYYNSNYLAAVNRAQNQTGIDLHVPIKVGVVSTVGPTVVLPSDARSDMVLSVLAENMTSFGSRQLSVVEIDEAYRLEGTLNQPAGTPVPKLAIFGQGSFLTIFPSQPVTTTYNIVYVAVPTDLAADTDNAWGGTYPSYHYLIAIKAAMLLLVSDGPGESMDRYKALSEVYDRDRLEAFMHIHPNRAYTPSTSRTVIPEKKAGEP